MTDTPTTPDHRCSVPSDLPLTIREEAVAREHIAACVADLLQDFGADMPARQRVADRVTQHLAEMGQLVTSRPGWVPETDPWPPAPDQWERQLHDAAQSAEDTEARSDGLEVMNAELARTLMATGAALEGLDLPDDLTIDEDVRALRRMYDEARDELVTEKDRAAGHEAIAAELRDENEQLRVRLGFMEGQYEKARDAEAEVKRLRVEESRLRGTVLRLRSALSQPAANTTSEES